MCSIISKVQVVYHRNIFLSVQFLILIIYYTNTWKMVNFCLYLYFEVGFFWVNLYEKLIFSRELLFKLILFTIRLFLMFSVAFCITAEIDNSKFDSASIATIKPYQTILKFWIKLILFSKSFRSIFYKVLDNWCVYCLKTPQNY